MERKLPNFRADRKAQNPVTSLAVVMFFSVTRLALPSSGFGFISCPSLPTDVYYQAGENSPTEVVCKCWVNQEACNMHHPMRSRSAKITPLPKSRDLAPERKISPERKFWAGYPCGHPVKNFVQVLQILEKQACWHGHPTRTHA